MKKPLCNAFLLDMLDYRPFVILTTHLPLRNTAPERMLRLAQKVVFDVICVVNPDHLNRLAFYAVLNEAGLRRELQRRAAIDALADLRADLQSQDTFRLR